MNKAIGTGSIDRSARVRRIKRVIIGLILIAILLPTVLCVLLFHRINRLEEEIADLSLKKETVKVVTENLLIKQPNVAEPATANNKYTVDNVLHSVSEADVAISDRAARDAEKDAAAEHIEALENENGITVDNTLVSVEDTPEDEDVPGDMKVKKVYLTFDDGPSSNTHRILDILNEYNVKGTFFVVGRLNDTTAPLYNRIVNEGHTIGMHSFTHKYNEIYANEDSFIYDVEKIQTLIYEQTGVMPKYYRFPGGSSNTVSKVPIEKLKTLLSNRGIIYYDWNVSSGDATATYGLSKDAIIRNCISGSVGKDEVMILMHDLPEKFTTTEALPEIIEYFQSIGAEILPIDETSAQFLHEEQSR